MVYLKMNGERVRSLRASTSAAFTAACAAERNRQRTRTLPDSTQTVMA